MRTFDEWWEWWKAENEVSEVIKITAEIAWRAALESRENTCTKENENDKL